ncbi:related to CHAPERONE PROTEIN DNAJ [Ramularia collo-cygni]|uniref:Related to CHAPERONE PROTEIN DNAJ n=1 Tax=Ramularia collo-cygni TaxID=112498 RepID=A0A2D3UYC4_9PEZI|nr:related to CHAPERONE PROTEIN DNAJ [Ramularia collo-cygni]CZT16176.1 related to CHAPERONE PROTEIN DNAJ [Ramularia collo-cygni]
MASQLLNLGLWWFLPAQVTAYAQPVLYRIFIRAGDPHPAPNSPRFIRDRKRIHTAVILLYLLYTIIDAEHQIQQSSNFYHVLKVPLDASKQAVGSRWRRLAASLHPDKAVGQDTAALFTKLKAMSDVLSDPTKRFAYDRFGPDILGWQNCKITRDYIVAGLYQLTAYYVGSAGILLLIAWAGYLQSGVFWRFYIMFAMFVFEVMSATRPEFLGVLTKFNTLLRWTGLRAEFLPFQFIVLLRKLAFTVFIALNQLGPLFEHSEDKGLEKGERALVQGLDAVNARIDALDGEMTNILKMEMLPFATKQDDLDLFKRGMQGFLEQNTVRNSDEVKTVVKEVLTRRRAAQGAAAEGN